MVDSKKHEFALIGLGGFCNGAHFSGGDDPDAGDGKHVNPKHALERG